MVTASPQLQDSVTSGSPLPPAWLSRLSTPSACCRPAAILHIHGPKRDADFWNAVQIRGGHEMTLKAGVAQFVGDHGIFISCRTCAQCRGHALFREETRGNIGRSYMQYDKLPVLVRTAGMYFARCSFTDMCTHRRIKISKIGIFVY